MLVRWPTWRACWPARADSLPQLASTAGEESTGSTYAGLRSACGASRPAGLRSLALVQLRPEADRQRVHPVVQAGDAVIETCDPGIHPHHPVVQARDSLIEPDHARVYAGQMLFDPAQPLVHPRDLPLQLTAQRPQVALELTAQRPQATRQLTAQRPHITLELTAQLADGRVEPPDRSAQRSMEC